MSILSSIAGAATAKYRIYLYAAAAVAIAAAVATATTWIMHLRARASVADALERREATLAADMACGAVEDVLACYRRRQHEIAAAQAKALASQQDVAAREAGVLQQHLRDLQSDLDDAYAAIDADPDDGPLPKSLTNAWARDRAKRGVR